METKFFSTFEENKMTRDNFDRILAEEGIDDGHLRDDIWHSRPADELDESKLRTTAKKFKKQLPGLRLRQSLSRALDREYNRE